jgi:hypothetical protein
MSSEITVLNDPTAAADRRDPGAIPVARRGSPSKNFQPHRYGAMSFADAMWLLECQTTRRCRPQ